MAKKEDRKTATLSISLSPELMDAVAARVDSGLYTSASEIIREALRLLLQVEHARYGKMVASDSTNISTIDRLASVFDLFDFGIAIQKHKLRKQYPEMSDEGIQEQLKLSSEYSESDEVIKPSIERLLRLRQHYETK